MRILPETATRSYSYAKPNLTNVKIKNQTRLVVPEEPKIPPPVETVKEAEIISEQQPSNQRFILDSHTCKGWPDDKLEKYEIVCHDGKVTRVIML